MSGSFRKFVQFKFTGGQLPGIESRFQFYLRFRANFGTIYRRCSLRTVTNSTNLFAVSHEIAEISTPDSSKKSACSLSMLSEGTISSFFLFPSCSDPLVLVQRDRENFRGWHQVFLVEWRRFPCKLRIYKLESSRR